ncbi:type IV toxin-antitoxin system AbiEi family antitoxin domain-containing protein [Arthrobacter sp. SLBN-122]|uniref:type IV toxin-antitoxin system AbiEi family antitoxin domain-containing protein n=1 Tax=Arthrobacter sp. SLBN-122 TaxID=2768455 RepID=UPI00135ACC6C|nr:type IV toxin-antitoxin system AbiEi family antitoxin domain-containing protein [Arthrobacter sp. SLBN-122]
MQSVIDALAVMGGVGTTNSLRLAGVSRRSIEAGVFAGTVQRVARGVYALPDADPLLLHAGRHHAVPGCVTALWQRGCGWSGVRKNRILPPGMVGPSLAVWRIAAAFP